MARSYDHDYSVLEPLFFFGGSEYLFEPGRLQKHAADKTISVIRAFCAGRKDDVARVVLQAASLADWKWLLEEPIWAYLALNSGVADVKEQALAALQTKSATEAACINDMAAFLIAEKDYGLAFKLLQLLEGKAGFGRFTVIANKAVIASSSSDFPVTDELAVQAGQELENWRNAIQNGELGAAFSFSLWIPHANRYLHALLKAGASDAAKTLTLRIILSTIEGFAPDVRDTAIDHMLLECLPLSRSLLDVVDRVLTEVSPESVAGPLVKETVTYCLEGVADPDRLVELDRAASGILCLQLLACWHEENGSPQREIDCLTTLCNRYPQLFSARSRLASALYRSNRYEEAETEVGKLIELDPGHFESTKATADINQKLLEEGIAKGLLERPAEVDHYQDPGWARKAWDGYHFSFQRFTKHQEIGVAINAFWVESLSAFLLENPQVKAVLNFGSFNGYFDKALADRFPDCTFIGYDRYSEGIDLSRQAYQAPNLEFVSDQDIDGVLQKAKHHGPVVLCHIRTCTTLYPAGVSDLYERCAKAGIDYILGVEGAGFSYQAKSFIPQDDPDRAPIVPIGVMVDHNYPSLVSGAGYGMEQQSVRPYPSPLSLRYAIGLQNVVVFLAKLH